MAAIDWPDVLRAEGLRVEVHNGWPNTPQPHGPLDYPNYILWHHDGSPPGDSPGGLDWVISEFNNPQGYSAQMWVGVRSHPIWHFVGNGKAWHAGATKGDIDNDTSFGMESDHTSDEPLDGELLDYIQRGIAAISRHEGWDSSHFSFHKVEAVPPGRKQDPYFPGSSPDWDRSNWNAELSAQRAIIQELINNGGDNSMSAQDVADLKDYVDGKFNTLNSKLNTVLDAVSKVDEAVWRVPLKSQVDNKPYHAGDFITKTDASTQKTLNVVSAPKK